MEKHTFLANTKKGRLHFLKEAAFLGHAIAPLEIGNFYYLRERGFRRLSFKYCDHPHNHVNINSIDENKVHQHEKDRSKVNVLREYDPENISAKYINSEYPDFLTTLHLPFEFKQHLMMGCDDMPNNIKLSSLKGPKFVQNEYAGRLLFHRTIGWHEHFQEWLQSYKLGANNCLLPSRPFLQS